MDDYCTNRKPDIDNAKKQRVHPPLRNVRLLPGTAFYDRQQDMLEFLAGLDTGSLLYNFRVAAGLPAGDSEPMTGWDAAECKLRGHTTGHAMSALSLAYAVTGNETYSNKLNELSEGLFECQQAFAASGKVRPGFLSAYDEEQFDQLEQLVKYPDIWAPYYTLDKIMAGLLDAYELAGTRKALDILVPLGDWVYERLSRVSDELRARMWDTYIAGEFGAMPGTMIRLYRISGDTRHLEAAKMFENAKLFDMMLEDRDGLDGMHANQHIPQIIGAAELYAATGNSDYLEIVRNFEKIVTGHHCYVIGGTGEEERFRAADGECSFLTEKTAESCASVNMLRLTSKLYEYESCQCTELMDYYERTLFNHILMSFSHCADGGTTYFMPLSPGSRKHYETEENSCCHGTGLESRFRFMADIYSYSTGKEAAEVRVELPVSSVLDDDEKMTVTFEESGRFTVRADSDMKSELAVRIPAWARQKYAEAEDGYLYFGRMKAGEKAVIDLPMEVREVRDASDDQYYSLAYGPYLLAAVSDSESILSPDITGIKSENSDKELSFREEGLTLKPLYCIDGENYHVYFHR